MTGRVVVVGQIARDLVLVVDDVPGASGSTGGRPTLEPARAAQFAGGAA